MPDRLGWSSFKGIGVANDKQPIKFLTVADVLQIHQIALARDGGLYGVRDDGLLASAVMTP